MLKKLLTLVCLILSFATLSTLAQNNELEKISIRATKASESIYMMDCVDGFGGGNVTVSVGSDGVLLVDNMFAQVLPKLIDKIKTLSDRPIKYEINSHFHGDHIGGNEILSVSAIIIAHANLRTRLESKNSAPAMLPTITFQDSLTLHFNGEEIKLIHLPNGHTDNDVVVYFTKSKVVHMGDMFFFGMFPAVYTQSGGNIKQLILNIEKVINGIPEDAKVVPGHGDLSTVNDLKSYLAMLKETTSLIEKAIKQGKTIEEVKKDKLLIKYDALGNGGAQTTDQYTEMLYRLLSVKS